MKVLTTKPKLTLIILLILIFRFGFSQSYTFNIDQALPLKANAGISTSIFSGESIQLGGSPSALDGYGQYFFSWEPSEGLDDPNSSNPIASPLVSTTYILSVKDAMNCLAQAEVVIQVETNSIYELEIFDQLKLYPNPTEGVLFVDFAQLIEGGQAEIYSVIGQIVRQIRFAASSTGQYTFNLSDLKTGLYYIRWSIGDHERLDKIILK
ncbi:MAG: T9SS type A sorting domain-containing protein [Bacteroidetes bacterium]|jgi:hypothetical protein|nr:T9SS type A sorting domain-containing protein [Bacteroidota bacterium]MBT4401017.1 T9SS type A sorting domain-containing protein [Bacteroidota bacterium]MBT4412122.1 T9SS type A sorting domain-containing protein [Bacteroidota bacterium]MBT5426974.1 T9SS type A sorting domain-containing protein [Bacteroidota bacterium]MBT7092667.1 T9SS type A sorting domain-containing protein [Bacteroidota bacterium]